MLSVGQQIQGWKCEVAIQPFNQSSADSTGACILGQVRPGGRYAAYRNSTPECLSNTRALFQPTRLYVRLSTTIAPWLLSASTECLVRNEETRKLDSGTKSFPQASGAMGQNRLILAFFSNLWQNSTMSIPNCQTESSCSSSMPVLQPPHAKTSR
jgi:hypothetical protein